jgi:hypothetical protein
MTVADSGGGHRRPFGAALPYPTLCGHPEAWHGHCGTDGCGNNWRLCEWPQCQPSPRVPLYGPGGAAGEVSAPGGTSG